MQKLLHGRLGKSPWPKMRRLKAKNKTHLGLSPGLLDRAFAVFLNLPHRENHRVPFFQFSGVQSA